MSIFAISSVFTTYVKGVIGHLRAALHRCKSTSGIMQSPGLQLIENVHFHFSHSLTTIICVLF
jgi:hypothetical protein